MADQAPEILGGTQLPDVDLLSPRVAVALGQNPQGASVELGACFGAEGRARLGDPAQQQLPGPTAEQHGVADPQLARGAVDEHARAGGEAVQRRAALARQVEDVGPPEKIGRAEDRQAERRPPGDVNDAPRVEPHALAPHASSRPRVEPAASAPSD